MRGIIKKTGLIIGCATLIVVSFLFVFHAAVLAQEAFQKAPLNPKFEEYMAKQNAAELNGAPLAAVSPEGRPTGLIPSPIDFTHLRESASLKAQPEIIIRRLPSSFDLRTENKVTPVKDQGNCGSCWAFAALASLESTIMPTTTDFSEQFIIDTHGFSWGPCAGGFELMAIADIAAHGAVAQNSNTYEYLWPTGPVPALPQSVWANAYLNQVELIPAGLDSKGNPVTVYTKEAVYGSGAGGSGVAIGFLVDQSSPYLVTARNGDECYYNNTDSQGDGHEVTIVGWNDSYPKSNFGITPPGNGAWLVKNSWGTDWGNSGYFWLSYYDKSVNPDAYVYNMASSTPYNWTYQYDPLGWTQSRGFGDSSTAWMANVFKAQSQGKMIRAVGLYTYSPNTTYTVKIYSNCPTSGDGATPSVDPVGGTLLVSDTGMFYSAGYNTHTLSKAVAVSPGANFSVVVELTDSTGYEYPIAVQATQGNSYPPYTGPSPRSTVIMGQSYISPTGAEGTWTDLAVFHPTATSYYYTGDRVCLKAFATAK
jgi:C1A family cysteine protease